MKKYSLSFILIMVLCLVSFGGCALFQNNQAVQVEESSDNKEVIIEKKVIHIFISCPEYAKAFQQLIDKYESLHPDIQICYETTQNDYPTLLKVRMNSGKTPDLFTTSAGKEIDIYRNWTYDLSEQPLAKTMLPSVAKIMESQEMRGGIYGVALKDNYFGLIYNTKLLKQAGVESYPSTISELKEVCGKLASHGYQSFTTGYSEWWVFKHIWQNYITAAAQSAGISVQELVKRFENGTSELSEYQELAGSMYEFINLTMLYGDETPKSTALVNQLESFAKEEAAIMVGQGTWVEHDLLELNPELKLGIYGYPVSEDPRQCRLIVGADQAVRVNKDSKYLKEVLDFVNWWYTSDYGISWFTDVACVIPPVKTEKECDFQLVKEGRAVIGLSGCNPLALSYSSDEFYQHLGSCLQDYVEGKITQNRANEKIVQMWHEIDGR